MTKIYNSIESKHPYPPRFLYCDLMNRYIDITSLTPGCRCCLSLGLLNIADRSVKLCTFFVWIDISTFW